MRNFKTPPIYYFVMHFVARVKWGTLLLRKKGLLIKNIKTLVASNEKVDHQSRLSKQGENVLFA